MSILSDAKKHTTTMLVLAIVLCFFVALNGEGWDLKLVMLSYALMAVVIILLLNNKQFDFSLVGQTFKADIFIGLAVGAGFIILNQLNSAFSLGAPAALLSLGKAGLFFSLIIVAPIIEEMFFRGFLLKFFQDRWNTTVAIIATSAAFAIFHYKVYAGFLEAVPATIGLFIGAFVFAVVMSMLVIGRKGQSTTTLERSIVAHGVMNFWLLNAMIGFVSIG